MAEEGRAVCVHGLPTDVDHERLRDKLLIHFLRQKNGGGEVVSVTIIGRTPLRALITFEESRVVQTVLRQHPHILQLDGIKYELSLSLPRQESMSLNKDTSQVVQSNSSCASGGQSVKPKTATLERLENPRYTKDELSKTNALSLFAKPREDTPRQKTSFPLEAHKKQDTSMTLKQTNLLSHTASEQCMCGANNATVKQTTCGIFHCSDCLQLHKYCQVCKKEATDIQKKVLGDPVQSCSFKDTQQEYQTREQHSGQEDSKVHKGIQGTMTCVEMTMSLPGYNKYTTAKITYCIPDGIQGDKDPCPGSPFEGGQFVAYLPLDPKGRSLLPCLEKAFKQGLTFTVSSSKKASGDAKVTWGRIPHKTRVDGGKSGKGYPDSTYLTRLCEELVAHGIEGVPAISQDQVKS
uniref:E3 ubiquitin-protein ligase n=1 Tax=Cyprinus carpio TaxID=7962 RepID=A0A8C2J0C1_CYPCA